MISRLRSEIAYPQACARGARDKLATGGPTTRSAIISPNGPPSTAIGSALADDRESYSYRGLDARANAYARWAARARLEKGDAVALFMPNRPEYVAIWFGLARAGLGVALVNTNLTGASLAHSLDVVAAKAAIVDAALMPAFASARALTKRAPVFVYGEAPEAASRGSIWRSPPSPTSRSTPPSGRR